MTSGPMYFSSLKNPISHLISNNDKLRLSLLTFRMLTLLAYEPTIIGLSIFVCVMYGIMISGASILIKGTFCANPFGFAIGQLNVTI